MASQLLQSHAAVVWLDHRHAFVARRDNGSAAVVDVDRGGASEADYLAEVVRLTDDCDRLMILGPGTDRVLFCDEYLAHHDRNVVALDIEASVSASPFELYDRLRLLES